jgi:hypothetical protein
MSKAASRSDASTCTRQQCIRWDGEEPALIATGEARPAIPWCCRRTPVAATGTAGHRAPGDGHRCRRHGAAGPPASAVHPELAGEIRRAARRRGRRPMPLAGPGAPQRRPRRRTGARPGLSRRLRRPARVGVDESECACARSLKRAPASGRRARRRACAGSGLADELVEPCDAPVPGHDTGKQDRRWQAMVGGDGSLLLPKAPAATAAGSRLPRGWRHEMASAVHQKDPLVRHLVGSHHGHGRPFLPAAPDIGLWRQLG